MDAAIAEQVTEDDARIFGKVSETVRNARRPAAE